MFSAPITCYSKKYRNAFLKGKTEEDTLILHSLQQYRTALDRGNILFKGTKEEEEENRYEAVGEEYEEDLEEYVDEDYDEEDGDDFEDEDEDGDDQEEDGDSNSEEENEGKTMFIWHTQKDGKVRPEHADRDGQEFEVDGDEWNELGQYNCRCEGEIISDDEDYKKEKQSEKEAEKAKWKRMGKERELETAKRNEREANKEKDRTKQDNEKTADQLPKTPEEIEKMKERAKEAERQNDEAAKQLDKDVDATNKLRDEAKKKGLKPRDEGYPKGDCAKGVREALNKAGVDIEGENSAKDWGKKLSPEDSKNPPYKKVAEHEKGQPLDEKTGLPKGYIPRKGDIVIVDKYKPRDPKNPNPPAGTKHGHAAMYNGERWRSGSPDSIDHWGGPDAREYKGDYKIYRRSEIVDFENLS